MQNVNIPDEISQPISKFFVKSMRAAWTEPVKFEKVDYYLNLTSLEELFDLKHCRLAPKVTTNFCRLHGCLSVTIFFFTLIKAVCYGFYKI